MGLFDKFFRSGNSVEAKLSLDTLLELVTISNNSFNKIRTELEKYTFLDYIISPNVPIEFQEERVELEEEYRNRFVISAGIVSLAIIEFLIIKKSKNEHNIESLIALKKRVFPNLLKIREKIILRNLDPNVEINYEFDDNENRIVNNIENETKFILLVSNLSLEIQNFIDQNADIKHIRNYFGYSMGQIFARNLTEKNEKIAEIVKTRIKIICRDLENFFFNQL
jgi:hypothetical protein